MAVGIDAGAHGVDEVRKLPLLDKIEIGSERRVDYTVLGNAVNVAARMEEFVASAGDICIGPATYEAVKTQFRVAQMGHFALKGLSTQVPMYKVIDAFAPEEIAAAAPAAQKRGKR